jgi:hypothetical protein
MVCAAPTRISAGFLCWATLVFCGTVRTAVVAQEKPASPEITFTLDFPNSEPSHFFISIARDGHATYESTGKLTADSEPAEPFHLQFTTTPETTNHVFDLAKKADNFRGEIDSKNSKIAFTGQKTLTYSDGKTNNRASYNYSPVPAVTELTELFERISSTLEFGRRLDYYYHYQKLALEDELRKMEDFANEGNLPELTAVAPILQRIVSDRSVMNVSRARAQRILIRAGIPDSKP